MKTGPAKAFEYAMKRIMEKSDKGIEIEIKPWYRTNRNNMQVGKSSTDWHNEMIEKYSDKEDTVNFLYWRHVTFKPKNKSEIAEMRELRREFGELGMSFDTGAGCGEIDWEFDWSFKWQPKDDKEFNEQTDSLDELIDSSGVMDSPQCFNGE